MNCTSWKCLTITLLTHSILQTHVSLFEAPSPSVLKEKLLQNMKQIIVYFPPKEFFFTCTLTEEKSKSN